MTGLRSAEACTPTEPGFYASTGAEMPAKCAAGTNSAYAGMSECAKCAAGTFQDEEGRTACKPCVAGSYCPARAGAPLPCSEGSYSPETSLTSVTECTSTDQGHYAPTGSTEQTMCSPGTVAPSSGMGACVKCAAGTFQDGLGGVACKVCHIGSYCTEGAAAALPCEAGTWSSSTGLTVLGECLDCPLGSACSTGATMPTACNPGTSAGKAGMSSCELCQPGKYQPGSNSTACRPCIEAGYCPGYGATSSTPCPGGTHSNIVGLYSDMQCTSVEAGYWAPTGSSHPEECPTSGFVCPGRAADDVNSPPGSKPILVNSGLASTDVEMEVVVFDLKLEMSFDKYNEAVAIAELAAYYGINASLVSISAEVVTIERRRLTGSNDTTKLQQLRLSVTILVPGDLDAEAAGSFIHVTAGGNADSRGPDFSTAERFASHLSQLNSAEGAGLSLLGANVTLTQDVQIRTVTQQVQESCPAGYWCSAGLKVECAQDTYQPLINQIYAGACHKCPEFASSLSGSARKSDCRCVEGYYDAINRLEDVVCLPCPFGSVCQTSGSTLSTLPLLPGYWRTSKSSSDLRRCPDASSTHTTVCANANGFTCKPWTTGPYCSLCNLTDGSRYFDLSQSACIPCGDTAAMSLAPMVVIIIVALLLVCWCSWKQPCKYLRVVGGRALSPMRAPVKQMITFYQALPLWHAAPAIVPH